MSLRLCLPPGALTMQRSPRPSESICRCGQRPEPGWEHVCNRHSTKQDCQQIYAVQVPTTSSPTSTEHAHNSCTSLRCAADQYMVGKKCRLSDLCALVEHPAADEVTVLDSMADTCYPNLQYPSFGPLLWAQRLWETHNLAIATTPRYI